MIIWNPIHILSVNSFGSCLAKLLILPKWIHNQRPFANCEPILRQSLGAGDNTHTLTENSTVCVRAAANKTRPIDYTINPFSPPRCDCGARLNGRDPSRQALTIELASACKVFRLSLHISACTSVYLNVLDRCARVCIVMEERTSWSKQAGAR